VLSAFLSCGKDGGPGEEAPDLETDEAILKVEIAYTGDLSDFEESVLMRVESSKASTLRIEGPYMERFYVIQNTVSFSRGLVDLTASASYTTSERSAEMKLDVSLITKTSAPKTVNAEIRFLADGKLVGTRKVTARSDQRNVFIFSFTKDEIL